MHFIHTSNPGYYRDDTSCPLKITVFYSTKQNIQILLVLLNDIKQKIKACVKTKAVYTIYKCGKHY